MNLKVKKAKKMVLLGRIVELIAAKYLKDEQTIAVGTDKSSIELLKKLAVEAVDRGYTLSIVPSSLQVGAVARELHLEVTSINDKEVDLAIEFAFQADEHLNFVKRETASFIRDKMIGRSAAEFIVIVKKKDFLKRVRGPVAFEIAVYGYKRTLLELEKLGEPVLRKDSKGKPVRTETGHYIVDVAVDEIYSLDDLEHQAKEIPGVIESGLFIDYADRILIHNDKIEVKSRIGPELKLRKH